MIVTHGSDAQVVDYATHLCIRAERLCPRCDSATLERSQVFDAWHSHKRHGTPAGYEAGCTCDQCESLRPAIASGRREATARARHRNRAQTPRSELVVNGRVYRQGCPQVVA